MSRLFKVAVEAFHQLQADVFEASRGKPHRFWIRAIHPTGLMVAWQAEGEKDAPIESAAILIDGFVKHGRHDELVSIFSKHEIQHAHTGSKQKGTKR